MPCHGSGCQASAMPPSEYYAPACQPGLAQLSRGPDSAVRLSNFTGWAKVVLDNIGVCKTHQCVMRCQCSPNTTFACRSDCDPDFEWQTQLVEQYPNPAHAICMLKKPATGSLLHGAGIRVNNLGPHMCTAHVLYFKFEAQGSGHPSGESWTNPASLLRNIPTQRTNPAC